MDKADRDLAKLGAIKSLLGHAIGAVGVHKTIHTILMTDNNFMAESANIKELMDEAEGIKVLMERKDREFMRPLPYQLNLNMNKHPARKLGLSCRPDGNQETTIASLF